MTITVDTTQKAVIRLDKDSTVLDLVQALTENLGGEWDDARLSAPTHIHTDTLGQGQWQIEVVLTDSSAPARASAWESEDGHHVARQNPNGTRDCSCGVALACSDDAMREHLTAVAGEQGWR